MNILSHGVPFCCDWPLLRAYTGEHTIRVLGTNGDADFVYDPARDDAPAVFHRISQQWPVDLAIFWTPEMYPPPARIEEAPLRTAACISDWNVHFAGLVHNLNRFDHVLCDRPGVNVFRRVGVQAHHLTPLYSHVPGVHDVEGAHDSWDVVFAGNLDSYAHPRRNAYLARLAAMDERYRIAIRCGLEPVEYGRLLAQSRLVFNHSIRGELNLRAFEAIACGACPLLESSNLEVRDWFQEGSDVLLYGDDSFEADIGAAIADSEGTQRIAAAALERAPALSGARRFDGIIRYCLDTAPAPRSFSQLPPYDQAVATAVQYSLGRERANFEHARAAFRTVHQLDPDSPITHTLGGTLRAHPFHPDYQQPDTVKQSAQQLYEAHRSDRESAVYALNAALLFRILQRPTMERRCLDAACAATTTAGARHLLTPAQASTAVRWLRHEAEGTASIAMLRAEAHFRRAQVASDAGDHGEAWDQALRCRECDAAHQDWPAIALRAAVSSGDAQGALYAAEAGIEHMPLDLSYRDAHIQLLRQIGRNDDATRAERRLARIRSRLTP